MMNQRNKLEATASFYYMTKIFIVFNIAFCFPFGIIFIYKPKREK